MDFLTNLPERHEDDYVCAVHGSPRDPIMEYVFPFDVKRPEKMKSQFASFTARICVNGHVHIPGVFTERGDFISPSDLMGGLFMAGDEKVMVNVGSVGQPRDTDNRSCYVMLDGDAISFHRVPYDFQKTQDKILELPDFDTFLAQRLEMGK
jgi:diadenosine tetraphosphatase ApaH/serine/threonine PP2A family protein phosphatase